MYIKAVILTSSLHLKSQPFCEKKKKFPSKNHKSTHSKTIKRKGTLIFFKQKMSTLYIGKLNWLQILSQILQHSAESDCT